MGAKSLLLHLNNKQMTFLNPLAQKSHVVKGIGAAGRYTMGRVRAGELCGLHTPPRPGSASCRLHGARPWCSRPAPPRCARLLCELSWLVCVPNTKCWLENPTDKVSPTFCGCEVPRGPSWRLLVKCVFCLLRPGSRV